MATFKIDYFELMILAENCIPPVPIARGMLFDNLTNKYHKEMSYEQRKGIFNFIRKNDRFDLNNESCKIFYYRFNPDNQYMVTCDYDVSQHNFEAFLMDEKYWVNSNTYITPELINNVKKIEHDAISIS